MHHAKILPTTVEKRSIDSSRPCIAPPGNGGSPADARPAGAGMTAALPAGRGQKGLVATAWPRSAPAGQGGGPRRRAAGGGGDDGGASALAGEKVVVRHRLARLVAQGEVAHP